VRTLFGPVFFYELIRLARKPRYLLGRVTLAFLLGLLFAFCYSIWAEKYSEHVPIHAQAELANTFFGAYLFAQIAIVGILTPGLVSGAIAEEKERRTLEFMLATDLRSREIIFGKLAARVGTMGLLLLAGLPILSFVQFFGGVDPNQLLAGFAATILAMLGVSAMSIYCSVASKRVRDAMVLAYLLTITYFATSLISFGVQMLSVAQRAVNIGPLSISWADVAYAFAIGNPIVAIAEVEERGNDALWSVLGKMALVQFLFIVGFVTWSVVRLRTVALRQSNRAVSAKVVKQNARNRPEIGDQPMNWKERYVESPVRLTLFGRIAVTLIGLVTIAIFCSFGLDLTSNDPLHVHGLSQRMNDWARMVGIVVACVILMGIAVLGSGSVRGERDRQTLDSLLMTRLSSREILWGKWWGCMVGMKTIWLWLGAIWLIGLLTGGIHPLALPLLVGAMLIYASGFAWIGIYCSIVATSSVRATLSAIIAAVFAGGGYMLALGICCLLPLSALDTRDPLDEFPSLWQLIMGFSPAIVMTWLPMRELSHSEIAWYDRNVSFVPCAAVGLALWVFLSYWLSRAALRRFQKQVNRVGPNRKADR